MMILTTPDFHNVFELAQQLSSEEQNLLAKKLHRTKTQHKTPEVAEFLWWDNTILSGGSNPATGGVGSSMYSRKT